MEEEINFFLIGLTSLNHKLSFLVVFIFAVLDPKQRPMIFILLRDTIGQCPSSYPITMNLFITLKASPTSESIFVNWFSLVKGKP